MEATNPNEFLHSKVKYRALNRSIKNYPYLDFDKRGLLTVDPFKSFPSDKVKIELVVLIFHLNMTAKKSKQFFYIFRYEVKAYYPGVLSGFSVSDATINVYFDIDPVFDFEPVEKQHLHSKFHKC